MLIDVALLVIAAAALSVLYRLVRRLLRAPLDPAYPLGIDGELVWKDEGPRSSAFRHENLRILGKPDYLYKTPLGIVAVEFKSRARKVKASDIAQALAAALAARGSGYRVSHIAVVTASDRYERALPRHDMDVHRLIEQQVLIARLAKRGKGQQAIPQRGKCGACAYTQVCADALV